MKRLLLGLLMLGIFIGCDVTQSIAIEYGAIEVESTPTGATIFLDGLDTKQETDATIGELNPDNYIVRLSLQDYEDWDTTVTVEAGDTTEINVVLIKEIPPTYGKIEVNSIPTGAMIWLDSDSTGHMTPYVFPKILVGDHILKLTMQGYVDWIDTVIILENQTTIINATLVEE